MTKNQKALIRQTTLFNRLNEGEMLNVKALAEEFGVTVRTIQKDFNERLCETYDIIDLGHGNYAFAEGYRFKGADDEEEKIAISLMKSLQHHAIPQMDDYINSAISATKHYEEIFLFDMDFEEIENLEMFKILLKAIQWKFGIAFSYKRVDSTVIETIVHPYRIANFKNYWYLVAHDLEAQKIKTYYMKGISKLRTLYENFNDDPNVEAQIAQITSGIDSPWYRDEAWEVVLTVSGDARYYLERHTPRNMKKTADSEIYATFLFTYHHKVELFTFVKKWIPDIRINDPKLQKELNEIMNTYIQQSEKGGI
jgi:predicted DNA-binding transcriptional regulator YafY